jgi:hypothetical protein
MKSQYASLFLLLLAFTSCASTDLGDYKYIGKKPSVKVTILSHKIDEQKYGDSISSFALEFNGVAQESETFPVAHYYLQVDCEVQFGSEKSYRNTLFIEMKGGKGVFESRVYLSDFPAAAKDKPVNFVLKEARWSPIVTAVVVLENQSN